MTGIVSWAAGRARMVLAFIAISLVIGGYAYIGLPKEGEPDIEIPALFVSVPFPGISAEDSEKLFKQAYDKERKKNAALEILFEQKTYELYQANEQLKNQPN